MFSAPGEGRECVEIARRVLALARDGVPFDRIAVLLRSPEDYRAHLEEAFARAGIPAHFARGAVQAGPGRARLLRACSSAPPKACRRGGSPSTSRSAKCPTPRLTVHPPRLRSRGDRWIAPDPELDPRCSRPEMSANSAGPTETDPATAGRADAPVRDGQLRAPRRWERLLVEAAVIGGRDRWRRRIDGLDNELRLKLAELGEEDETQAAALARTLDDLAALRRLCAPAHR